MPAWANNPAELHYSRLRTPVPFITSLLILGERTSLAPLCPSILQSPASKPGDRVYPNAVATHPYSPMVEHPLQAPSYTLRPCLGSKPVCTSLGGSPPSARSLRKGAAGANLSGYLNAYSRPQNLAGAISPVFKTAEAASWWGWGVLKLPSRAQGHWYQSAAGCLMYAMLGTQLDIAQ